MEYFFTKNHFKRYLYSAVILLTAALVLHKLPDMIWPPLPINSRQGISHWVKSQSGNDDSVLLNLSPASKQSQAPFHYDIRKFAQIGIISLADASPIFPSWVDSRREGEIKVPQNDTGITIIDPNKTSSMSGEIEYWEVFSLDENNEVRLVILKQSGPLLFSATAYSESHIAGKGLNFFSESAPVHINKGEIVGIYAKKKIATNHVRYGELRDTLYVNSLVVSSVNAQAIPLQSSYSGSFSYTALAAIGETSGKSMTSHNYSKIPLPAQPSYAHLPAYQIRLTAADTPLLLKSTFANAILNNNPYAGFANGNSWASNEFGLPMFLMLATLAILFIAGISLNSPRNIILWTIGSIVILILARQHLHAISGIGMAAVACAYTLASFMPGAAVSSFFSEYREESFSGKLLYAFAASIIFWFIPAMIAFRIKTTNTPVLIFGLTAPLLTLWPKNRRNNEVPPRTETPTLSRFFFYAAWAGVFLIVIQTMLSSRFQWNHMDTFSHIAFAAKNAGRTIAGYTDPLISGLNLCSLNKAYAYNIWYFLLGMVVKLSGIDPGTAYCLGCGMMVILLFTTMWWALLNTVRIPSARITAFTLIVLSYAIRQFATFGPVFQKSEFTFSLYSSSIPEFSLFLFVIILAARLIVKPNCYDAAIFLALNAILVFFHMQMSLYVSMLTLFMLAPAFKYYRADAAVDPRKVFFAALLLSIGSGLLANYLTTGPGQIEANPAVYFQARFSEFIFIKRWWKLFAQLFEMATHNVWLIISIVCGGYMLSKPSKGTYELSMRILCFVLISFVLTQFNPVVDILFFRITTIFPFTRILAITTSLFMLISAISIVLLISEGITLLNRIFSRASAILTIAAVACAIAFTIPRWNELKSMARDLTYNNSGYIDITYVPTLPEVKFLNSLSRNRDVTIIAEAPYNYVIPGVSSVFTKYHDRYLATPEYPPKLNKETWQKCLDFDKECAKLLSKDDFLWVRNAESNLHSVPGLMLKFQGREYSLFGI